MEIIKVPLTLSPPLSSVLLETWRQLIISLDYTLPAPMRWYDEAAMLTADESPEQSPKTPVLHHRRHSHAVDDALAPSTPLPFPLPIPLPIRVFNDEDDEQIPLKFTSVHGSASSDSDFCTVRVDAFSKPYAFVRPRGIAVVFCLLVPIIVIIMTIIIVPLVIRYISTGSIVIQPPSFYTRLATTQRTFSQHYDHNGHITAAAQTAILEHRCQNKRATPPLVSNTVSPAYDSRFDDVHVLVDDTNFDLFPFLWDSIMQNHSQANAANRAPQSCHFGMSPPCFVCPQPNSPHCHRTFADESIRFHLLNKPLSQDKLNDVTTLLIVGEHWQRKTIALLNTFDLHADLRIGIIMLTAEFCDNGFPSWQHALDWEPRLSFVFIPYGDCRLDARAVSFTETSDYSTPLPPAIIWPLGPSMINSFPSVIQPMSTPNITERSTALNLMVTYSTEKPTRMQAWIYADAFCRSQSHLTSSLPRQCTLDYSDTIFKMASEIDRAIGTSFQTSGLVRSPTEQYVPALKNSIFTLCPAGKNAESYRIWEAIMAGSIPVIERTTLGDDEHTNDIITVHPSYGTKYGCRQDDEHSILTINNAPVIFIDQWSDLDTIMADMTINTLQNQQHALRQWYTQLLSALRTQLFRQIRAAHQPSTSAKSV